MSSRRRLVSRQSGTSVAPESSPSRGSRASTEHINQPLQIPPLPPYEAPAYPLTTSGKRALDDITNSHDYRKYRKHLEVAIKNVTNGAAEGNDLLTLAKERVRKLAERREEQGTEKSEVEEKAEERAADLEEKVGRATQEAEKALRELIDLQQELLQQEVLMKEVSDQAATRDPAGGSRRRSNRRRAEDGEDGDEEEDGDADYEYNPEDEDSVIPTTQAAVLSPTELYKQAKENYATSYASKTLRERYAESNDYKGFKRVIHDAQHPGADAPPVPNPSAWFPEDEAGATTIASTRRRRHQQANADEEEEEDEDIVFAGAVSSLKCPLTLRTFKEPYSNNVCNHTFEKSAILDMHNRHAVAFDENQGRRGRHRQQPEGPRLLKCPEAGCDAMLALNDFFLDEIVIRKIKRAELAAAREDIMDEGDGEGQGEHDAPAGTQDRPADVGDDTSMFQQMDGGEEEEEDMDDEDEEERQHRIKRERMSRGSAVPLEESWRV